MMGYDGKGGERVNENEGRFEVLRMWREEGLL
jgi:hypothetical protein